jgi:hypothetical protein
MRALPKSPDLFVEFGHGFTCDVQARTPPASQASSPRLRRFLYAHGKQERRRVAEVIWRAEAFRLEIVVAVTANQRDCLAVFS